MSVKNEHRESWLLLSLGNRTLLLCSPQIDNISVLKEFMECGQGYSGDQGEGSDF